MENKKRELEFYFYIQTRDFDFLTREDYN